MSSCKVKIPPCIYLLSPYAVVGLLDYRTLIALCHPLSVSCLVNKLIALEQPPNLLINLLLLGLPPDWLVTILPAIEGTIPLLAQATWDVASCLGPLELANSRQEHIARLVIRGHHTDLAIDDGWPLWDWYATGTHTCCANPRSIDMFKTTYK